MELTDNIKQAFRWANEDELRLDGALRVLEKLIQEHDAQRGPGGDFSGAFEIHFNCGEIIEYGWAQCYRTDVTLPGPGSRFRLFRPISEEEKKGGGPVEQVVEADSMLESVLLAIDWIVDEEGLPEDDTHDG